MPGAPPKSTKSAIGFLFVTVLLNIIGLGIIIPVLPSLLVELTGKTTSEVAPLGGYLLFVYAIMQFIMSPILGGLSDRFGRRSVILVSVGAYSVDFLLMALAPSYAWLFIGRLLSGASAATYSTANAFIADVSPPEDRAGHFGLLGAAFGIGFIIGPGLGGYLGEIGTRVPFFASAAICFCNFIYGYFILPESLPPERRRPFDWKRANPLGSFLQVRGYPIVLGVLVTFFFMQLAHFALPAIWAYYGEVKFNWKPGDIGASLMYVGLMSALVQGGLTRKIIPRIGEKRAVYIGLLAMVVSFLGYAFGSPSGGWVFVWITIGSVGGFMMPAMQGLMSAATPEDAQGELQGAIASVMSVTMIVGPVMFTQIFNYYTSPSADPFLPGAPFVVSAVLLFVCLIPFWLTMRSAK